MGWTVVAGDDVEGLDAVAKINVSRGTRRNFALLTALLLAAALLWNRAKAPQEITERVKASSRLDEQPGATQVVRFVTVNTEGPPLISTHSGFPAPVVNLGEGIIWRGYQDKISLLSEWLQDHLDTDLIIFFDGMDVLWGGCSEQHLVNRYHEIVSKGVAKIVFGAELSCFEHNCSRVPAVPSYALANFSSYVEGGWCSYEAATKQNYACPSHTRLDGADAIRGWNIWNDSCFTCVNQCGPMPSLQFLNSGFFMGPAKELRDMLDVVRRRYEEWSCYGDQSVYSRYWLERQGEVTLDYGSRLVLNLADFGGNVLEFDQEGRLRNKLFNQTQCFIHGNSMSGKQIMQRLTENLPLYRNPQQLWHISEEIT